VTPALGVLEVSSIARGLFVVDALVKRAEVTIVRADPITPGKYVIVFVGGEEECFESLEAADDAAQGATLDKLLLPNAHIALVPALDGHGFVGATGSLGVLELTTVAATLLAADRSLKTADVSLVALHLARGIDGKGYLAFTGSQDAVEAALESGEEIVAPERRAGRELIARPHPDVSIAIARLRLK
jgi:microcompartment protein CcmL/EutN